MLTGIVLMFHAFVVQAAPEAVSIEDVCRQYPQEVVRLFAALDLDRKDLAEVKNRGRSEGLAESVQRAVGPLQSKSLGRENGSFTKSARSAA